MGLIMATSSTLIASHTQPCYGSPKIGYSRQEAFELAQPLTHPIWFGFSFKRRQKEGQLGVAEDFFP